MAIERTLTIIKPDAVAGKLTGRIVERLERENFRIIAAKLVHLTQSQAEGFYAVHRERPFFSSLTKYMTEGPVLVMVLEAEDAIRRLRTVMGATDPAQAAEGTIRKQYGRSIERNVVHGSDAPETARFEIGYFFNALEIA
ncbi:MAG: nucleoside-diphosphate kinase [Acidobacteria bacterium]|jgi:nucleoside-diphosphate kinase|nr:nucleoside-diphosphate kinase [Acidobacteriota bacterium]